MRRFRGIRFYLRLALLPTCGWYCCEMRLPYLLSLWAALLVPASFFAQETWVDQTASAAIGGILNDVEWGAEQFVAVGTNSALGLIFTSPDGETWTDQSADANIGGILNGVAYASGRFVVVGTNTSFGVIASSTDGAFWFNHTQAANVGGILHDVAYGNGVWLAVGETGSLAAIATSTNGFEWVNRTTTSGIGGDLFSVAYGNGTFVAVGSNGASVVFATSANGRDWQNHTLTNGIGGVAYSVSYDGSQFVATGDGTSGGGDSVAHVLVSDDGATWTSRTVASGLGGTGYAVGSGGGSSVIVGRTGAPGLIAYSADAINWTDVTADSAAPGDLRGVTRGLNGWVAVGTNQVNGVVMVSESVGGGGTAVFFEDDVQAGAAGGSVSVNVVAGPAISWTVTEDADWITLSGASGTGDGEVTVSLQTNQTAFPRSAVISLDAVSLTVFQAGTALTTPSLNGVFDAATGSVSLSWTQALVAEGYEVERREGDDGAFSPLAEVVGAASRSLTDEGVEGGRSYGYRVRAVAGELSSDWSDVRVVNAPPDIPSDFAATARNDSQIELSWSDVYGETGYLIYKAAEGELSFNRVARLEPDETRYVDSGLQADSVYRYEIEAESSTFGRRSDEAIATTKENSRSIVWAYAASSSGDYFGVAVGGGVAVAVGARGRVTTSADLVSWTERESGTQRTLRGIAYGQGGFLAVGDGGMVLGSTNGNSWSIADSGTGENLVAVAFQQDLWVAVGAAGTLLTSPDGEVWTSESTPAEQGFVTVFAGDGKFVAVESSGRFLTSEDGASWTQTRANAPSDETEPFFWTRTGGAWGEDVYSVVGPNGYHSFSSDADSWEEEPGGTFNYFEAVAYGADHFVAVGIVGRTGISDTGQGYVVGETLPVTLHAVAHGPSGFVTVGDRGYIASSVTGQSWTERQAPEGTAAHLRVIVAGPGQLVAFGENDFDSAEVVNDFDGNGWTEHPFEVEEIEFSPSVEDAVYVAGNYIAVGGEGLVSTSNDGVEWITRRTREEGVVNDGFFGIAAGQGKLLIGGGRDPLMESLDNGITWSPVVGLPSPFSPWNIGFANRWVGHFGGFGSIQLHHSEDGSEWKTAYVVGQATEVDTIALGSLGGESLWLGAGASALGEQGQSIVSWDGRNWNANTASEIDASVNAIAYGAGVFVAVGNGGSMVWASLDGVDWEAAPAGLLSDERGGFFDVAYFHDRFYAVGSEGLIVELGIAANDAELGPVVEAAMVEMEETPDGYRLTWQSQLGLRYRVLERADLETGSWTQVGAELTGTGAELSAEVAVPEVAEKWYWVVVALE